MKAADNGALKLPGAGALRHWRAHLHIRRSQLNAVAMHNPRQHLLPISLGAALCSRRVGPSSQNATEGTSPAAEPMSW